MTTKNEIDERAITLLVQVDGMDRIRLMFCFQALGLPKGMTLTRGFTRTEAARRINEFLGVKAVTRSSKPPKRARALGSDHALEVYVSWAIAEAERRGGPLQVVAFSE